jgi:uncharacterized protein (DUF58 family)
VSSEVRSRSRATPTAVALGSGALALVVLYALTGYRELVVMALVVGVVLVMVSVIPRVGSPIRLRRIDTPRLVERGAVVRLTLEVAAEKLVSQTTVIDQLAGVRVHVALPQVRSGEAVVTHYELRALRRGAHRLGPILEERTDPLGLVIRSVPHDATADILVHPVVHRLRMSQGGSRMRQARAVVPRFSEDPLADFRSLREYVVGDDQRLVHWPSTAKTGALMVRDHFELRRTTRTVILETSDRAMSAGAFEEAVEIAASLVAQSIEDQIAVTVRTRHRGMPGPTAPVRHVQEALELFARVQPSNGDDTVAATRLRLSVDAADEVFLIASPDSPLVAQLSRSSAVGRRLTSIRVLDGAAEAVTPGLRCIDVVSAEQFAVRWAGGRVSA